MRQQHLLRDYRSMAEGGLGPFALNVGDEMDGNTFFPTPKVPPKQITDKANEFLVAYGKCEDGTKGDTAHKKAVKLQLIALLDTQATDCEETAQGSVEMLSTTGYHLSDPNPVVPTPVGTVSIVGASNMASTKLRLDLSVQGNVWAAVVQMMNATGGWGTVEVFTDLNDVVLVNLVPGTVCTLRVCGMAAGNQQSEWSDVFTHMAT